MADIIEKQANEISETEKLKIENERIARELDEAKRKEELILQQKQNELLKQQLLEKNAELEKLNTKLPPWAQRLRDKGVNEKNINSSFGKAKCAEVLNEYINRGGIEEKIEDDKFYNEWRLKQKESKK